MARLAALHVLYSTCIFLGLAETTFVNECPGYKATNVQQGTGKLTADLHIAGDSCNVFGTDLHDLKLLVEYQTSWSKCRDHGFIKD